jgi:CRISPR-associated exonuclease Cas4
MPWTLTVTDLKQYVYCPRILYFSRCLPGVRPVTAKMEEGIAAHEEAEAKERRRELRAYGFASGERHFDVDLYSAERRLTAVIDLVIVRPDGQNMAVPVDYKLSTVAGPHFKLQLACYGLLVEEEMGLPTPYGFLYLIPERRAEKVPLGARLRAQVIEALSDMRSIVEAEAMPGPVSQAGHCVNCEFRRFCNDVI